MIYKEKFKISLKDIGKGNTIKNKGILEIFENIATHHSTEVGYGPNDVQVKEIVWVLLDWKLKVLKRPKYGQDLEVHTWARMMKKTFSCRDFEIYNEQNELCVIGTSKWVMLNPNTGRICRIDEKIAEEYQVEEKTVFREEELEKINPPEKYGSEMLYQVYRKDIDLNGHMHNLYYLDLAYETLPQEIFEKRPFNNVRIQYKFELKLGDKVNCRYAFENDEHIVTIYNKDCTKIHAIIILS